MDGVYNTPHRLVFNGGVITLGISHFQAFYHLHIFACLFWAARRAPISYRLSMRYPFGHLALLCSSLRRELALASSAHA
jgi:hypothetical protein